MIATSPQAAAERVLLDSMPFPVRPDQYWNQRGRWPASWIGKESSPGDVVVGYRLPVKVAAATTVRVHVAADERYELFLDGVRIGRGNERGDLDHWFFESYDLHLSAGAHVLAARVWHFGALAPYAQFTLGPAFLLAADSPDHRDLLSTGHAPWVVKNLDGFVALNPEAAWGTGANTEIDGRLCDWQWATTSPDGWVPVKIVAPAYGTSGQNDQPPSRLLRPATLKPQLEGWFEGTKVRLVANHSGDTTSATPIRAVDHLEAEGLEWAGLLRGEPTTVPANTTRRILLDANNYLCAYPEFTVSGGRDASVRVNWQEALFEGPKSNHKGNRDVVEGKYFTTIWQWTDGLGDRFIADGGPHRTFTPLWWQAGRYIEVLVTTQAEPITFESFGFRETGYPLELAAKFESADPRLAAIVPIGFRTLRMCAHETYMDCPYYEQLQYIGDTRLQALVTYVTTDDDRLPRKALQMFDWSRLNSGITQSRYPTRVRQVIPPFSLWWVGMVHDFALWRGDMDFVRSLMIGVRSVMDTHWSAIADDGLFVALDGWNYMDWVPSWRDGIPADGQFGKSAVLNLQLALIARHAAELEEWVGEPTLAARHKAKADALMEAVNRTFFDKTRGMYADDTAKTVFSEHAQVLALLEGTTPHADSVAAGLLSAHDLAETTIYFSHYLFEVFQKLGRTDRLLERMKLWFWHLENGLKTTIEHPEPTRSDCHAWGAHPIFHYYATVLGVRPVAPGMKKVTIKPNLGPLGWADGTFPTPHGPLRVRSDGGLTTIELPSGVEQVP